MKELEARGAKYMVNAATYDSLVARQLSWAALVGVELEGSCVRRVEDNVYSNEMHPLTRAEFERGGGREPEGKMKAVNSSSALVVNVFDYW